MKQGYLREKDLLSYIPILEKAEQMKDSIFESAYAQAFSAIGNIIRDQKVQKKQEDELANGNSRILKNGISPNIVMVNGGRGSGKTSTMKSVVNYLVKERRSEEQLYPEEFLRIKNEKMNFVTVELVDPSLFEDDTSIMYIVLGGMFIKVEKAMNDTSHTISQWERRQILASFQEVFEGIKFLDKQKKKMGLTELEELKYTADVLEMASKVKDLIDNYLKIMTGEKESKLIIPIDDMDLNSRYAYKMLEEIRKYFSTSNIIIILAANKDQLIMDITQVYMENYKMTLSNELYKANDMIEMAERYMEKLVPTGYRIALPNLEDAELNGVKVKYTENEIEEFEIPISDYLRKKIYEVSNIYLTQDTNGVERIIGSNLRMYANTINVLHQISEKKNEKDEEKNEAYYSKRLENAKDYQVYFMDEWCSYNLKDKSKQNIREIYRASSRVTNKIIISSLTARFEKALEKYKEHEGKLTRYIVQDNEFNKIVHQDNYAETLSYGDVAFIIHYIERNLQLTSEDMNYIFAVKMVISFKLFNAVTQYKMYKCTYKKMTIDLTDDIKKKDKERPLIYRKAYCELINGGILNTAETISYYKLPNNKTLLSDNKIAYMDGLELYSRVQKFIDLDKYVDLLKNIIDGYTNFEVKWAEENRNESFEKNILMVVAQMKEYNKDKSTNLESEENTVYTLILLEAVVLMISAHMSSRDGNEKVNYRRFNADIHRSIKLMDRNKNVMWDMTNFWMKISFDNLEDIPEEYSIYWDSKENIHEIFKKLLGPLSVSELLKTQKYSSDGLFYTGSFGLTEEMHKYVEKELKNNSALRINTDWLTRLQNYVNVIRNFKEKSDWKTFCFHKLKIIELWELILGDDNFDKDDIKSLIHESKINEVSDEELSGVEDFIQNTYVGTISTRISSKVTLTSLIEGLIKATNRFINRNINNRQTHEIKKLKSYVNRVKKFKGELEKTEKARVNDKVKEYNEDYYPELKQIIADLEKSKQVSSYEE